MMSLSYRVQLLTCLMLISSLGTAWSQEPDRLKRVLITNDDGINEERLLPLANAFAAVAETWVVASTEDRSGSSNYSFLGKYHQALSVQRILQRQNLTAYAVAGYPADCVIFGVTGLLKHNPPDVVVSGVNGGPNLGIDGWFGSGTVGAARTAAFLGVPAIAVSGLDDDDKDMVARVCHWVVALAGSKIVADLAPGQFLTVAIPRIPGGQIRGVRIARRMPPVAQFAMERVAYEEDDGETREVWALKSTGRRAGVPQDSDGPLLRAGYIVITPMQLGEDDGAAIDRIERSINDLPPWPKD